MVKLSATMAQELKKELQVEKSDVAIQVISATMAQELKKELQVEKRDVAIQMQCIKNDVAIQVQCVKNSDVAVQTTTDFSLSVSDMMIDRIMMSLSHFFIRITGNLVWHQVVVSILLTTVSTHQMWLWTIGLRACFQCDVSHFNFSGNSVHVHSCQLTVIIVPYSIDAGSTQWEYPRLSKQRLLQSQDLPPLPSYSVSTDTSPGTILDKVNQSLNCIHFVK